MILTNLTGMKLSSLAFILLCLVTLSFNVAAEELLPGNPGIHKPADRIETLISHEHKEFIPEDNAADSGTTVNSRLRGALYMVIVLLVGLLVYLFIRSRPTPGLGGHAVHSSTQNAIRAFDGHPEQAKGTGSIGLEDMTPLVPMHVSDDPTPLRRIPAPVERNDGHDQPVGLSDIHKDRHGISGHVAGKVSARLEDLEFERELELARAAFDKHDYKLCQQYLAVTLQSGNPVLEAEACELLKASETALIIADEDLNLKSSLRLDAAENSTPA